MKNHMDLEMCDNEHDQDLHIDIDSAAENSNQQHDASLTDAGSSSVNERYNHKFCC